MANLEVNFCGVRIKNPIVASSAEPTLNSRNMKKCIDTRASGDSSHFVIDREPARPPLSLDGRFAIFYGARVKRYGWMKSCQV